MASQYLFPDYIFSNPLLLDAAALSSSSDASSAATTMHWSAGEVNNYIPPFTDHYPTMATFMTNNMNDSMLMPLDHQYSSSDNISSSSAATATAFFGSSSDFWPPAPPPYPIITATESWEMNQDPSTLKVTRYSAEEKKHRIIRYLKKKSQRNFNKTIKYACRKNLADKRVRVRGRFAKNKNQVNSSDEDPYQTMTAVNNSVHQSCYNNTIFHDDLSFPQVKTPASEEEWLQEAIASFMYYRILPDVSSIS